MRLHEPEIGAHDVRFRWDVTPVTDLYQRTDFRMSFPPELDLQAVPHALWWRILLICLYPHWALFAPAGWSCRSASEPVRQSSGCA